MDVQQSSKFDRSGLLNHRVVVIRRVFVVGICSFGFTFQIHKAAQTPASPPDF